MGKRGPQPQADGDKGRRVTLYLSKDAARALDAMCPPLGGNKSALVSRLICDEFDKSTGAKKKDRSTRLTD